MTNGNGHIPSGNTPPLMTATEAAAYIEQRLSLEDAIEVLGRDELELRLRVNGAEMTADLGHFYSAYARDPAQLDTIVRNFMMAALGITPNREVSDFAALADRVYPMLKPIALLATV